MLDYTDFWDRLVEDIVGKLPAFSHIDPKRIAIAAAPRWAGSTWGNLACCISLRQKPDPLFSVWIKRNTRTVVQVSPWFISQPPEVVFNGTRRRYLILLRLPRALEHNPLETLIHELYHIDPKFDGSIRPLRHGKEFDWEVRRLMREWIRQTDPELAEMAQMKAARLREHAGSILARTLPSKFRPMLTDLIAPAPRRSAYIDGMARLYPNYRLAPSFDIRSVTVSPADIPRRITERDCPIRAFHASGAETLSPVYARLLMNSAAAQSAHPRILGLGASNL